MPRSSSRSASQADPVRAVSVFPLVACALLLPQPARAQAPPSALVQIDAIVTDARGARVADLQAEDFEVIEEGTARPVERALLISGGGGGAPEQAPLPIRTRSDEREAAGRAGARLFAIFIDEYHITDGPSVGRTREALARFVDSLGPRDLVLLARPLDSLVGLRLTRDREALKDIIGLVEGRNGDYRPRNEFERSIVAGTPDRIEAARSQIVTSALAAMAAHLESLGEGRKALVVISEGFARQPARRDGGLPTIDAVVRAANRAATSIYPIDPRAFSPSSGPAVASDDAASAMLRALASDTSGWPAINPGDAAAGLPHVLGETGGYYLLADVPPDAAAMYTAHELTHALEDQHYDLDRNMREMIEDDDLAFATSAVHEGSATILMELYTMHAMVRGEISTGMLRSAHSIRRLPATGAMPTICRQCRPR